MWLLLLLLLSANNIHQKLVIHEQYEKSAIIEPLCRKTREFYFWSALANSQLRNNDKAIKNLKDYLNWLGDEPINENHQFVAEKLLDELKATPDKIGNIAKDMNLVEHKLRLAMGGPQTQEVQKRIVKQLDEQIDEIEKQMQQAQQQEQANGQKQSQIPAGDSKIMQGEGKGEVENKKLIVSKDKWGSLPEKEKTKAIQELQKQLPAHIIEASEGYYKKLNGGK